MLDSLTHVYLWRGARVELRKTDDPRQPQRTLCFMAKDNSARIAIQFPQNVKQSEMDAIVSAINSALENSEQRHDALTGTEWWKNPEFVGGDK